MKSPQLAAWEKKLDTVLDEIDRTLEAEYGDRFRLHPARPEHGSTSDPAMDGLFRVEAHFSPGYGTDLGRGYILRVQTSTLDHIPADTRTRMEDRAAELLRTKLRQAFPGRELAVTRDGSVFKIHGDLSLGR